MLYPASGSNAPEVVIGFCSVVVWTTPTRSYGRITGYDVRFIPQTSGSDMMVSKGRKELFHAVGGLVSTDNVMVQVKLQFCNVDMQSNVQVRAKTSAAEGKWSELVPLGMFLLQILMSLDVCLHLLFHPELYDVVQVAGMLVVSLALSMSESDFCSLQ